MNNYNSISLCAKWTPSEVTSSKEARRKASIIRKYIGWSPRQYRKTLSSLRGYIDVVERRLCKKDWGGIDYEKVPSRASMIYRKTFKKHDEKRYSEFLDAVEKGEKKINAGALYPYDIVNKVLNGEHDRTLEEQWKNLPNYCGDKEYNALVVCDTSGSMWGSWKKNVSPLSVAISLSLYFGERIKGAFNNHFITFSQSPELQKISGRTLKDKVKNLKGATWGRNTDLMAVFNLILGRAVSNNIPEKEMPDKIILVSDMAFDTACRSNKRTNFEQIEKKYKKAGYKRPDIIFWNVNAFDNQMPVTKDEQGTSLVSGCSPSIFKAMMQDNILTPYDLMLGVLNSDRYGRVVI